MSEYIEQRLLVGNCLDTLKRLADDSIDSIVTDPPYELGFMGKSWDNSGVAYQVSLWQECLRVLKPGGHLLAFGGTRTYHRMAVAIEDAGFEIRDSIHWTYGSGFPKSLDVSKAIDKAAKAERKDEDWKNNNYGGGNGKCPTCNKWYVSGNPCKCVREEAKPITKEAKQWQGWGTALKPSHEPIVLARKPFIGTVAENVLQHSTGGINIDGTRIGTDGGIKDSYGKGFLIGGIAVEDLKRAAKNNERTPNGELAKTVYERYLKSLNTKVESVQTGRFPANTLLTHNHDCQDTCTPNCPIELFPNSKGMATQNSGANINIYGGNSFNKSKTTFPEKRIGFNDDGSASRFFHNSQWTPADDITPFIYQAKAGKKERNAGLDELPMIKGGSMKGEETRPDRPTNHPIRQNFHPTVKPIELMRYLIKLITPPKGTVLDPFLGSGTTAVAAILDGFEWKGCEMTEDYLPIIKGRVAWARKEVKEKAKQEQLEL